MSVKLGGLRLKIGFSAAAFAALLLNRGPWRLLALSAAAVMLHELTHLCCMRRCGCRQPTVEILPGGVMIRADGFSALGYRQAALCLISAPAANLLVGGVFLLAAPKDAERARFFGMANLALGAVNCLPLSFLDGGKTLECLLAIRGMERAARIRRRTDSVCLLLMLSAAAVMTAYGMRPLPYTVFCLYCLIRTVVQHRNDRRNNSVLT